MQLWRDKLLPNTVDSQCAIKKVTKCLTLNGRLTKMIPINNNVKLNFSKCLKQKSGIY